jgi:hypothetical protein
VQHPKGASTDGCHRRSATLSEGAARVAPTVQCSPFGLRASCLPLIPCSACGLRAEWREAVAAHLLSVPQCLQPGSSCFPLRAGQFQSGSPSWKWRWSWATEVKLPTNLASPTRSRTLPVTAPTHRALRAARSVLPSR